MLPSPFLTPLDLLNHDIVHSFEIIRPFFAYPLQAVNADQITIICWWGRVHYLLHLHVISVGVFL